MSSKYVLRWFNGSNPTEYFPMFEPSQKLATRFASEAEARAATPAETMIGFYGHTDCTGYKVIRLVKKVKP